MRKKNVTVKQIQKLDRIAIHQYGVPSLSLMENAGKSVAQEVLKAIKRKKNPKVCVICGLGNNAGDGFVAARHLINAGIKTAILLIGRGKQLKQDAAVNYNILKKIKFPITEIKTARVSSLQAIKKADIVVDAIFGVGLNRSVSDPFRTVIETVNKHSKKVLSIDIPSGLDGTSGQIYGICVKADVTVTFTCLKKGFFEGQGPKYVGKAIAVDIGIPMAIRKKFRL